MKDLCPTCKSIGFPKSVLGDDRCTFCDGTEGGHPPEACYRCWPTYTKDCKFCEELNE